MKKHLLLAALLAIPAAGWAQQKNRTLTPKQLQEANKPYFAPKVFSGAEPTNQASVPFRPVFRSTPNSNQFASTIELGTSVNLLTAGVAANYICALPPLGTVVVARRGDGSATGQGLLTGNNVYIDKSVNNGDSWTVASSILINSSNITGIASAFVRYPQVALLNPTGNTNPDNIMMTGLGPVTSGEGWAAYIMSNRLMSAASTESSTHQTLPFTDNNAGLHFMPGRLTTTRQGVGYSASLKRNDVLNGDTMVIIKSVYNVAQNKIDYSYQNIPFNIDSVASSTPIVAFAPNGQIGYIAIIGNQFSAFSKRLYYPVYSKTTNGGATWSPAKSIYLDTLSGAQAAKDSIAGDSIREVAGGPRYKLSYHSAFTFDMSVDYKGNPHMLITFNVGGWDNLGNPDAEPGFSVRGGLSWMSDVYTANGGTTWKVQPLADPKTWRGCFGSNMCTGTPVVAIDYIISDIREQAAATFDGKRIFLGWFSTDTTRNQLGESDVADFGNHQNRKPDLNIVGFNVDSGTWTKPIPLTVGTAAEGVATLGNIPEYVFETDTAYEIPVIYTPIPTSNSPLSGQTFAHFYINDLLFGKSLFGTNITSAKAKKPLVVSKFEMWPNPTESSVSLNIQTAKPARIHARIYSLIGKEVAQTIPALKAAGNHSIELNLSHLPAGIYFCKLDAGGQQITRKLVKN